MKRLRWIAALASGLVPLLAPALASAAAPESDDLLALSLEELASYRITSVSRGAEALSGAAAAVHVITPDDIRRAGYTTVADALRLVPGVQVARTRSSAWSIGARGFNGGLSNKLLVLIDGRSVYSPLFAGVFWELQHVNLDDLARIEVIRGPGGTLWGANAVNGVINIITRPAGETQGGVVRAGGGNEERGFGNVRYGAEVADGVFLRAHAAYFERDGQRSRGSADDAWRIGHFQLRSDWELADDGQLTLLGGMFGGQVRNQGTLSLLDPPFALPVVQQDEKFGGHLLARWEKQLAEDSELALQAYWDYTDLEFTSVRELRHTLDLDLQHHFEPDTPWLDGHELTWGLGYRTSIDELEERISVIEPDSRDVHLVSGFVQDRIPLIEDVLDLTLGTKLEYNDLSGFEFQPSGRFSFTPHELHTFWGAASRAVRTPTRLDEDARLAAGTLPPGAPGNPSASDPAQFVLFSRAGFESEEVLAFEVGYRTRALPDVTLDVAAFYNRYDDLVTFEFGAPLMETVPVSHVVLPFFFDNQLEGESYGVEVAAWWQLLPWWRVHAWYAYLQLDLNLDSGSTDTSSVAQEDQAPHHQALLRSSLDLPGHVELDTILRFVDDLPGFGVRSHVELDARVGWRPRPAWELSVAGRNLLDASRQERSGGTSTRVQRSVYGQVRWEF